MPLRAEESPGLDEQTLAAGRIRRRTGWTSGVGAPLRSHHIVEGEVGLFVAVAIVDGVVGVPRPALSHRIPLREEAGAPGPDAPSKQTQLQEQPAPCPLCPTVCIFIVLSQYGGREGCKWHLLLFCLMTVRRYVVLSGGRGGEAAGCQASAFAASGEHGWGHYMSNPLN